MALRSLRAAVASIVSIALTGGVTACGVVWDAPEIHVVATSDEITFGSAKDEAELVGGETIVKIANNSGERRRIVLARVDNVGELPQKVRDAELPHDDDRILGMTSEMRARRQALYTGGVRFDLASARFHVHLRADETYVVFDTMDEPEDATALWFHVPGDSQ